MITRTFSFLLISLTLTACTLLDPEANLKSERELWEQAQGHMDGRRHLQAITSLEELDRRFPFGQYADGTQLDLVYAYFKSSKYELARLTADRFIRLNPVHPEADYAQYMKGLSSYASNDSMVSRYLPGDETGRDIGGARDAINDFTQLLTRYPDSEFKEDATLRLIYVRNQLAEYEVNVSRYYIRKGAYLAAANRARQVVEGYPSTPAVIDSLIVMHLAYEALGLPQESQDALFVLSENYPKYVVGERGNQHLATGVLYDEGETLTSILTLGLMGNRGDLADRLAKFSESRRLDASRRPQATLRSAEDAPSVDAPRVVDKVFF
ncbi:MAG: outer membrane protein assembly factor BamD [Litorivicinaceae bacterium]|nr:MAG: outer membrane protein assembly factor BamD [Litorivicinaceae bacterium]CAI8273364.1 MAG: Outer membrane protein assembly factor BamD [Gammaproteobacteria bacterium]